MTSKISSLAEKREEKREKELIWSCDCKGQESILFFVHIDGAVECSFCGLKTKEWMDSIE